MTLIPSWSTTAASNTSEFPENQAPSTLNNGCREVQAAIRTQHEQACWIDLGHTPTRTADLQFTVVGDQTAQYTVGRRTRFTDTTSKYGVITVSAYTSLTTVTVVMDSGVLVSPTAVAVGILDANSQYATTAEVTSALATRLPSGLISLWSGAISAIPTGWLICDGTNGTPNLTDRFVIHASADSGATYNVDDTGGSLTHSHEDTLAAPAHEHNVPITGWGAVQAPGTLGTLGSGGPANTYNVANSRNTDGASETALDGSVTDGTSIVPYYALAYIMKS